MKFVNLPNDVMGKVVSTLNTKSLKTVAQTSQGMHKISQPFLNNTKKKQTKAVNIIKREIKKRTTYLNQVSLTNVRGRNRNYSIGDTIVLTKPPNIYVYGKIRKIRRFKNKLYIQFENDYIMTNDYNSIRQTIQFQRLTDKHIQDLYSTISGLGNPNYFRNYVDFIEQQMLFLRQQKTQYMNKFTLKHPNIYPSMSMDEFHVV